MYETTQNRLKRKFYNFIRKMFWKSYDPNEDFSCGNCGKEMLRRFLYCSVECSEEFDGYY